MTPVRPQGLRVIGFAVRPNQNWKPTQGVPGEFLGDVRRPLQDFGFTSRSVDVACEHKTPLRVRARSSRFEDDPWPGCRAGMGRGLQRVWPFRDSRDPLGDFCCARASRLTPRAATPWGRDPILLGALRGALMRAGSVPVELSPGSR